MASIDLPAITRRRAMIEVKEITKIYAATGGMLGQKPVKALRGVSLTLADGEAISLIGESGCGKTTLGRIIAGLEASTSGDLVFDGTALSTLSPRERHAKFQQVQLIQQDPYGALNPARPLGEALADPLRLQAKRLGKDASWVQMRAKELLQLVGLDPANTLYKYPHNLSGGQRQRFVIARALTVEPKVLVADEAVSMIDVSLRLGILSLLSDLRSRLGISVVFITHDVAAARYVAPKGTVCVIYRGEIVEYGATDAIIASPVHPYTQALLSAMPVLRGLEDPGPDRYIPAQDLDLRLDDEGGCLFRARCRFATDRCAQEHPPLVTVDEGRRLHACFYPEARHVVAVPIEGASL